MFRYISITLQLLLILSLCLVSVTKSEKLTTYTLLMSVDYESGTLDSNVTNLQWTNANASDAATLVTPGFNGSKYAIAHKVEVGNSGYFSNNNWRSESSTNNIRNAGLYQPGDERRYEISLRLHNWIEGPYVSAIFQSKLSGGGYPAWLFIAFNNSISFRVRQLNITKVIVPDYRPIVDKWISLRVDCLWADDQTGYLNVSAMLPGDTDYSWNWYQDKTKTWNPEANISTGYTKWGLYLPDAQPNVGDPSNTRVIYHDNFKIYQINHTESTTTTTTSTPTTTTTTTTTGGPSNSNRLIPSLITILILVSAIFQLL
ncbi:hypothetical protein SAMD00019534_025270 [Acytostelium subglobosum LB1]|uniref:hypothetical protein n=1 Tax=Acytostelium subglobosum LB1 TaxID=1410327 RepID=UPI000644F5D9|nr:hypothetical protein SAMD00019534_025270 [Acytostelium subglobosum LB1]GAM19352.1 hypothetical protein SAMD00019534_025270 [Acytostelium subglobosum LB1]|eukprot:XP_012757279.1 hypothetical protein SAMD00019534_025270 [Acytostelium subglobosum LB1]